MRACTVSEANDLPSDSYLLTMIRQAVKNKDEGKNPVRKRVKGDIAIPDDFTKALASASLQHHFAALAPSHQKEYIQAIESAKKPETRQRRIDRAVEQLMKK